MSRANVELVRRWFRGFERAELGLDLCDPAIEIRNWAEFPVTGPYVGHDGVQHWWDDIADAFEDLDWELLEANRRRRRTGGHGPALHRPLPAHRHRRRLRMGAVISVSDGKIASAIGYPSPGLAKKAGGLTPPNTPSS